MHKLLALLLTLIIGVQTVHQGLIYTYFTLSKDYIVQHLCENKETPDLQCNGKCHLKQVLSVSKKINTPEETPVPNLEEIKVPTLFFQALEPQKASTNLPINKRFLSLPMFRYSFQYAYQVLSSIFHPPQV